MQSKLLIAAFVLFLAGCATDTPPGINTVIQKVEVPIAVPCKAEVPVKPDFNFDKLAPEQDIFDKSKAALADRKLHIGYETELLAALKSCM
jgi:PBP1b-binding outer membrane lipoprotein LpoB